MMMTLVGGEFRVRHEPIVRQPNQWQVYWSGTMEVIVHIAWHWTQQSASAQAERLNAALEEPMSGDELLLKEHDWTVECRSPFEIRNLDGSFATGLAAELVLRFYKDSLDKTCEDGK